MKLTNIKEIFIFQNNVVEGKVKQGVPKVNLCNKNKKYNWTWTTENYRIIKTKQRVLRVRIDNAFLSKKNYMNIDNCALYKAIRYNKDYFVNYNIEMFPGTKLIQPFYFSELDHTLKNKIKLKKKYI